MPIVVPIVTEYNGKGLNSALKEIKQAEGGLGKLSSAGKVLGATLGAAGAAFAVFQGARFIGDAVQSASDLNEALSKNRVLFGQSAQAIRDFASGAAVSLGQTETQALNAAGTFAVFGKSASLAGGDLVNFSTSLTTLASDLASFYNTSSDDAITAIGAALRGETEPIRRYGVLLNQASLEAEAFAAGITKTLGPITQQERVLAAQSLILKQTTDAQGDFSRTQDGLANTTKTLSAAFENAKASIGEGFLIAINSATAATGGAGGLGGNIEQLGDELGIFTVGVGEAVGALLDLVNATQDAGGASADAGADSATFVDTWVNFTRIAALGIPGVGLLANQIYTLGDAAKTSSASIDAAYDSTIRLATAARDARNEAQFNRGAVVAEARDPGLDRLANERRIAKLTEILGHVPGAIEKVTTSSSKGAGGVNALAKASDVAQQKFDKLGDRVKTTATRLQTVTGALDEAKKALSEYSADKSSWLTGQFSLSSVIDAQIDQTLKLADLDKKIAEALAAGDNDGAAKLQAEKAGESAAVNWVDGFRKQIADSKAATESINTLLKSLNPSDTTGNKALLDALTTLSPEDAKMAADDLVNRNLGPTIAAELAAFNVFAGSTGDIWAGQFYQEGVDGATAQVNAIKATLESRLSDLYQEGKKMGKAVKNGYESVSTLYPPPLMGPAGVEICRAATARSLFTLTPPLVTP